jgi:GTP-binding protein Era
MAFRAGVVAVIGKPNVGKTTIVNAIVGERVGIISDKPQTTRKKILGIANLPNAQIVFVDTPGIHQPHSKLGKVMVDTAIQSLEGADAALFVVDVSRLPDDDDKSIARILSSFGWEKTAVALNKMDRLRPEFVEENYAEYDALTGNATMMYTTALVGENIDKLTATLVDLLPAGPPLYDDPDYYTDQTVREIAGELVREQILRNTREEVPHGIAVVVESWDEPAYGEEGIVRIGASIVVERASQKPILIGKKGAMLKKIGTAARANIENILGRKVFLELFVKVREGWRDSAAGLRDMGLIS